MLGQFMRERAMLKEPEAIRALDGIAFAASGFEFPKGKLRPECAWPESQRYDRGFDLAIVILYLRDPACQRDPSDMYVRGGLAFLDHVKGCECCLHNIRYPPKPVDTPLARQFEREIYEQLRKNSLSATYRAQ